MNWCRLGEGGPSANARASRNPYAGVRSSERPEAYPVKEHSWLLMGDVVDERLFWGSNNFDCYTYILIAL